MNSEEIMQKLKDNRNILIKYGVKKIGLFGSFSTREQKDDSDIDFLVEFKLSQFGENFKGLYEAFMKLSDYLENLFGRKVELIPRGSLSPYIAPYIENRVIWYEI